MDGVVEQGRGRESAAGLLSATVMTGSATGCVGVPGVACSVGVTGVEGCVAVPEGVTCCVGVPEGVGCPVRVTKGVECCVEVPEYIEGWNTDLGRV